MLLREHLQGQHREGSVVSEGNHCKLNRGCDRAGCARAARGLGGAASEGATTALPAAGEPSGESGERGGSAAGEEGTAGGGGREAGGGDGEPPRGGRESGRRAGTAQACVPSAEEEGLPPPAAMTLRFLAAMDEGYVGSRREENARLKRRRRTRDDSAG